jgi:hypothetical protein
MSAEGSLMGSEQAPTRTGERRLKFSSVRGLESQGVSRETPETPEFPVSLAAIGRSLTDAYVAVARRALLGVEALQDGRARRRATKRRPDALFPN